MKRNRFWNYQEDESIRELMETICQNSKEQGLERMKRNCNKIADDLRDFRVRQNILESLKRETIRRERKNSNGK